MKKGILILACLVIVLDLMFFIFLQYYPSEKFLKGYGGPCILNYCEGNFLVYQLGDVA
jgi:hypothetical protein